MELIYLALPNTEVSRLRVAERVAHGGHNIPTKDIQRRFPRSLSNLLNDFSPLVDQCQCYFNADEEPVLIFEQQGLQRTVYEQIYLSYYLRRPSMTKSSSTQNTTVKSTHESLRVAVKEALERKRKLGQYSVIWRENQVITQGDDAPQIPNQQ